MEEGKGNGLLSVPLQVNDAAREAACGGKTTGKGAGALGSDPASAPCLTVDLEIRRFISSVSVFPLLQ